MHIKDRTDEAIQITYMNHRSEMAERRIIPIKIWFGKTEWHSDPQWLMKAWDCDKEAERDFAMKRIVCPKVADHNEQTKRIAELEGAVRNTIQAIEAGRPHKDAPEILSQSFGSPFVEMLKRSLKGETDGKTRTAAKARQQESQSEGRRHS